MHTQQLHMQALSKYKYLSLWYTREESFGRVKYVPLDRKSELRIFKNATGCNGRRLLHINKNVTRTHSSGILHVWNTRDVIQKRATPCVCCLKTQLCHKPKRQTRQWKTPVVHTQELHIHALSKKKYFSRVVYAREEFRAREICTF